MLTCLVSVLFTFYIQDVLKLKKNNSGAKRLSEESEAKDICFLRHGTFYCLLTTTTGNGEAKVLGRI
jgi:hypothetical protein